MQHIDEYERLRHENERELWIKQQRELDQKKHGLDHHHYSHFSKMMEKKKQPKKSWFLKFLDLFGKPEKINPAKAYKTIYFV